MSVLSDIDIHRLLRERAIKIEPLDVRDVGPCSVDVHIANQYRVFVPHGQDAIDPKQEQESMTQLVTVDDVFVLHPGQFALATTIERVTLSDIVVSRIEGKSSIGRLGLQVHATAGYIDAGFSGQVTLELFNVAPLPIRIYTGMPIGQLAFMEMSSRAAIPYGSRSNSKYQGQVGPVASQFWRNWCTCDPTSPVIAPDCEVHS